MLSCPSATSCAAVEDRPVVVARTEVVREHRYFEQASLCLGHSVVFDGLWALMRGKLNLCVQ